MIKLGIWVLAFSYLPVILYALFGPNDGNPVGPALLAIGGSFVGGSLTAFGVLLAMIRRRSYRSSTGTANI